MHLAMGNSELIDEIEASFPQVEMPAKSELSFHKNGCDQCRYLRDDLEERRGKEINGDLIRYLHQELGCLSTAGLKWILRDYLKFCLTPEAEYNMMETEFLIYHLGPDLKYQKETLQQLSGLSRNQIDCLIHFLEWSATHPKWGDYCPENIEKALNFMRAINA
jgi:hypothetical protein